MGRLDEYLRLQSPKSRWKRDARRIMTAIVAELDEHGRRLIMTDDDMLRRLTARIDAAYPFGVRELHPYKAWLAERRLLLRDTLRPLPELPQPTLDDLGACEVATDLLAMADDLDRVGKAAEAKATRDEAHLLLIKQAPNRMNRPCPVCGAKIGNPCDDVNAEAVSTFAPAYRRKVSRLLRIPRLVPHLSRLDDRRGPQAPLPLFDGVVP